MSIKIQYIQKRVGRTQDLLNWHSVCRSVPSAFELRMNGNTLRFFNPAGECKPEDAFAFELFRKHIDTAIDEFRAYLEQQLELMN